MRCLGIKEIHKGCLLHVKRLADRLVERSRSGYRLLRRRRLEGSFTLEAAFVMPIVIFTILGIVTFSMWQRDMIMMQAKMIESAQISRSISLAEGEAVLDEAQERLFYSVFGLSGPLQYGGSVSTIAYGRPYGIYEGLNLHFSGTVVRKDYYPVSFLRKCNLIQSLVKR